ncbi:MAG: hypothetical protein GF401_09040 [Chitinivibrionales bacterium]|nr:hypothetical protein [Chitinivibrionales bacterium]
MREIIKNQVDLTANRTDYVQAKELPENSDYAMYQKKVNEDGFVPSQAVIRQHIDQFGRDYRQEIQGPHPVERFRSYESVVV